MPQDNQPKKPENNDISIDITDDCIQCMTCVQTLPTIFKFDGTKVTAQYDGTTPVETVRRVATICPVGAILIKRRTEQTPSPSNL